MHFKQGKRACFIAGPDSANLVYALAYWEGRSVGTVTTPLLRNPEEVRRRFGVMLCHHL